MASTKLIIFYKSPKYRLSKCLEYILSKAKESKGPAVIAGDINWNLNSIAVVKDASKQAFIQEMVNCGFHSKTDLNYPSTDGNTTIDIFFSNIPESRAWYYELYFNYHKGICAVIPKVV